MAFGQQRATTYLTLDPALAPAKAAIHEGHWTDADRQLRLYLTAHPDSAEALYLLGTALLREDKPRESLQTFTHAASLAGPSARDLHDVALDYVLLNDYDDADKWITRAARESPGDGETWYAMGRIKYTENRFSEAVDSFQRALRLTPRWVKAENNLGLSYEGLNRPDDAVDAYRQAIAWQSGSPHPSEQPFLNLGILLTDRNQLDEALNLLRQAEALSPKDARIHGALGKLYARREDFPQARAEFEQAVAAEPNNSGLHFQLGQVYRKLGMADRAAAELKQAAAVESRTRR